jgi:hypothetical protein
LSVAANLAERLAESAHDTVLATPEANREAVVSGPFLPGWNGPAVDDKIATAEGRPPGASGPRDHEVHPAVGEEVARTERPGGIRRRQRHVACSERVRHASPRIAARLEAR